MTGHNSKLGFRYATLNRIIFILTFVHSNTTIMKKLIFMLMMVGGMNCYGQAGNWLWAKQGTSVSGNQFVEEAWGCAADALGNVYAAGIFTDSSINFGSITLNTHIGGLHLFIVKHDANGNVIWAKTAVGQFASNQVNSVATDKFGNVYVTGYFGGTIIFDSITLAIPGLYSHMFVVKYDSNGNVIWAKCAGASNGLSKGSAVSTDIHGNVYVMGSFSGGIVFGTTSFTGISSSLFIVKYDMSGNILWAHNPSGYITEGTGNALAVDTLENVYLTGWFYFSSAFFGSQTMHNTGSYTTFLVKYDASGIAQWAKNPIGKSLGNSVSTDKSGNIYLTGRYDSTTTFGNSTFTSLGASDVFIAKYNPNGVLVWVRKAGGVNDDYGMSVANDASGIYVVGGFLSPSITFGTSTLIFPTGAIDPMFMVKYDFDGNVICASALASGGDDLNGVATDGMGNAYVCGDFTTSPFYVADDTLLLNCLENFFVAKYRCPTSLGTSELQTPNSEITLYPNPTSGIFTIESTSAKLTSIKIMNVLGECVYQSEIRNSKSEINLTGVSKGIYFLQANTTAGIVNKKIMVE